MRNGRNVMSFADKLETYHISSNNSRGRLFLFSHKKEAMIVSNITHWKSNKLTELQSLNRHRSVLLNLIALQLDRGGDKGREDCERGGRGAII